jgi:wyosine [tRNA(Phe)-imidazoG37] synthetase (radical SAM superfamily)
MPHGDLELSSMIEGLKEFSDQFNGSLITETMLIRGMNDGEKVIGGTANLIRELSPKIAYLTVPIRPPSESSVEIPSDDSILKAAAAFTSMGIRTVPLTEREVGDFTFTGYLEGDILAITSVHPMREDSIRNMVARSGEGWKTVIALIDSGKLTVEEYLGDRFYRRDLDGT